jgi:integrase
MEQKSIETNPFKKIRFRVKRGKKPGALSPEQVAGIMNASGLPVKRDMVAFPFYQGWRIREIRKLRWEEVDVDKGSAWVVDPKNGETTLLTRHELSIPRAAQAMVST